MICHPLFLLIVRRSLQDRQLLAKAANRMKLTIGGLRCAVVLLPLYWLAIFIGTHLPPKALVQLRASDKLLHFSAFFGLSFLICWAISTHPKHRYRNVIIALLICVVYAIFDEVSQIPVGRTADIKDFAADILGAISGASVYVVLRALLKAAGWKFAGITRTSNVAQPVNIGSKS